MYRPSSSRGEMSEGHIPPRNSPPGAMQPWRIQGENYRDKPLRGVDLGASLRVLMRGNVALEGEEKLTRWGQGLRIIKLLVQFEVAV